MVLVVLGLGGSLSLLRDSPTGYWTLGFLSILIFDFSLRSAVILPFYLDTNGMDPSSFSHSSEMVMAFCLASSLETVYL